MDVYGASWMVKRKEAELDAKQAEITTLRQTVSNLKNLGFGENRPPRTDRVSDRKKGGNLEGQGRGVQGMEYPSRLHKGKLLQEAYLQRPDRAREVLQGGTQGGSPPLRTSGSSRRCWRG